jgi:hypothetical protein
LLLILSCAILIVIASVCLGYAVIPKTTISGRLADTIFASYWVGLSILFMGTTAAVCFGPVGSFGIFALLGALLIVFSKRSVRDMVSAVVRNWRAAHTITVLGVLSITALLSILVLPWHDCHDGRDCMHDTGLYHAQIIRWYSSLGAVPGMALLHHRLGFHSGVFALAAIFDAGRLIGRSGSAVTLATVLVSLFFTVLNLSRRQPSARNLFWPAYLLLASCSFGIDIAADYPDVTLTFLVGALFWMAWTWWEWRADANGVSTGGSWTLIVVGAGAMSVKLSGSLLLGVAFVIAIYLARISARVVLKYSGLLLILAVPTLAVQGITSGYPFYPAVSLALPVSWAAPGNLVPAVRSSIERFPLYGYEQPFPLTMIEKARKILFEGPTPDAPLIAGMLAVFLVSAVMALRRRKPGVPVLLAAAMGAIGLIQLIQVMQLRFTFGYLAVLPALVLAYRPRRLVLGLCAATLAILYIAGPGPNRLDMVRMLFLLAAVAWLLTPFSRNALSMRAMVGCIFVVQLIRPIATIAEDIPVVISHPQWMLAPAGPLVPPGEEAFVEGALGEVRYKQPVDGYHCWAESLPCAPPRYQADWLTLNALWYRCNAQRLACGFTAISPVTRIVTTGNVAAR